MLKKVIFTTDQSNFVFDYFKNVKLNRTKKKMDIGNVFKEKYGYTYGYQNFVNHFNKTQNKESYNLKIQQTKTANRKYYKEINYKTNDSRNKIQIIKDIILINVILSLTNIFVQIKGQNKNVYLSSIDV
jgi:hypothetical protein